MFHFLAESKIMILIAYFSMSLLGRTGLSLLHILPKVTSFL